MFCLRSSDRPPSRGGTAQIAFRWLALFLLVGTTQFGFAVDTNYTKKPRFKIPYQSDPDEMKRIGAVEIQLHVSRDQGQKWELVDSVSPKSENFNTKQRLTESIGLPSARSMAAIAGIPMVRSKKNFAWSWIARPRS